jgi:hypothetical protein
MRTLLTVILLFVYSIGFAGKPDTAGLSKAVFGLSEALLHKDTVRLKALLHKKVQYGHSNGWIETKRDIIENLYNGKLTYNKLAVSEQVIVEENGVGCVRSKTEIDVSLNGKPIQMTLHVLQVWIKEKKGWVLLSRQSTKIN